MSLVDHISFEANLSVHKEYKGKVSKVTVQQTLWRRHRAINLPHTDPNVVQMLNLVVVDLAAFRLVAGYRQELWETTRYPDIHHHGAVINWQRPHPTNSILKTARIETTHADEKQLPHRGRWPDKGLPPLIWVTHAGILHLPAADRQ